MKNSIFNESYVGDREDIPPMCVLFTITLLLCPPYSGISGFCSYFNRLSEFSSKLSQKISDWLSSKLRGQTSLEYVSRNMRVWIKLHKESYFTLLNTNEGCGIKESVGTTQ